MHALGQVDQLWEISHEVFDEGENSNQATFYNGYDVIFSFMIKGQEDDHYGYGLEERARAGLSTWDDSINDWTDPVFGYWVQPDSNNWFKVWVKTTIPGDADGLKFIIQGDDTSTLDPFDAHIDYCRFGIYYTQKVTYEKTGRYSGETIVGFEIHEMIKDTRSASVDHLARIQMTFIFENNLTWITENYRAEIIKQWFRTQYMPKDCFPEIDYNQWLYASSQYKKSAWVTPIDDSAFQANDKGFDCRPSSGRWEAVALEMGLCALFLLAGAVAGSIGTAAMLVVGGLEFGTELASSIIGFGNFDQNRGTNR